MNLLIRNSGEKMVTPFPNEISRILGEPVQLLGNGSYGQVVRTSEHLLVKSFDRDDNVLPPEFVFQEIGFSRLAEGTGSLPFSEVYFQDDRCFVVMEEGEVLSEVEPQPRESFREVCIIIARLHARGILHLDLKIENLIRLRGKIRLIDFGLAALYSGPSNSYSPLWRAPECYLDQKATAASEVWALGILLLTWILGKYPLKFDEDFAERMITQIPEQIQKVPDRTARRLLRGMLKFNPRKRMTLDQVLAHPYVNVSIPMEEWSLPKVGVSKPSNPDLYFDCLRVVRRYSENSFVFSHTVRLFQALLSDELTAAGEGMKAEAEATVSGEAESIEGMEATVDGEVPEEEWENCWVACSHVSHGIFGEYTRTFDVWEESFPGRIHFDGISFWIREIVRRFPKGFVLDLPSYFPIRNSKVRKLILEIEVSSCVWKFPLDQLKSELLKIENALEQGNVPSGRLAHELRILQCSLPELYPKFDAEKWSIATEDWNLRFLRSSDQPALQQLLHRPENAEWFIEGEDIAAIESLLQSIQTFASYRPFGLIGLFQHSNEKDLIGFVGLVPLEKDLEIGFLLDSQFRGKGWIHQATSYVLKQLIPFCQEDYDRLVASTTPENRACRRLLEKMGFQETNIRERFGKPRISFAVAFQNFQKIRES